MNCKEAIYSNDYFDFVSEYGMLDVDKGDEACSQHINERYDIVYMKQSKAPKLSISNYGYFSIPSCLGPLDSSPLEPSGILNVIDNPLSMKGKGVLMGFLDSGIDYENQLFRNSDGSSRIEAIWDQTEVNGIPPKDFIYGHEYRREVINEALASDNPKQIVATTDTHGHGTFMASVAIGNMDKNRNFSGVAPQASIAMVKLKQAKQYIRDYYFIKEDAQAYQMTDIMAALKYLHELALEIGMPLVICMGLGTNSGGHLGQGPIGSIMSQIASQNKRAIVIGVGNEGNKRLHYQGKDFKTGHDELVEIHVGNNVKGFTAELWAKSPDVYSVEIISPTGKRFPRIISPTGKGTEHTLLVEDTNIVIEYEIADISSGEQLILMRFEEPMQGIWIIRVFGDSITWGGYDIWLTFSGFLSGEVFFIRSSPDTTLTVPSSTELPITVGAYDSYNNSISNSSGRGFMNSGAVKPEFVAPGVNIMGADLNNTMVKKSGTGAAAAITAGVVALVLEWAVLKNNHEYITNVMIKYFLVRGATTDNKRVNPNKEWGYGILNLYESINHNQLWTGADKKLDYMKGKTDSSDLKS